MILFCGQQKPPLSRFCRGSAYYKNEASAKADAYLSKLSRGKSVRSNSTSSGGGDSRPSRSAKDGSSSSNGSSSYTTYIQLLS